MTPSHPSHRFSNGDEMPLFGLGTWQSEPGAVRFAVEEALRLGYRHVDCAHVYGNEGEIGDALAGPLADGTIRRDDLWVTSKLWNNSHAPEDVVPALENTLADLGLDRLDLYLIHWPVAHRREIVFPETSDDMLSLEERPLRDTWTAMEDAVDRGLTRHIGVSNFSAKKIDHLLETCRIGPEVLQVELHPYLQQNALLDYCRAKGILMTAYCPLGSPSRPERLVTEEEPVLLDDPVVADIAAARGATPAQILIAWAIGRGTAVIPKTVTPARLRENLEGAGIVLTDDEMGRLATLDRHRRYIAGNFWAKPGGHYSVENLWDE